MWLPIHCTHCQDRNGHQVGVGESVTIQTTSPQSADVVFLVEQNTCINDFQLNELPKLIDSALVQQGMVERRFGIVGFNSDSAMVYSAPGKDEFTDANSAETVLNRYGTNYTINT